MSILNNPAERAAFVFGQPMKPCPKCGSYRMMAQTPIVMKEPILATDTAEQLLGKWARTVKDGNEMMEGPFFMMCRSCGHKGPAVDCSGRSRAEVGQDRAAYAEVKRLWNEQETVNPPVT